ncbi:hypothetical protein ABID26_004211 [Mesorhizobium shonense]|uniref:Transposase n=1 Tax=Mesorhizobium shonense TaxID=1209948 RepID=A0ABV2HW38_9HYPH
MQYLGVTKLAAEHLCRLYHIERGRSAGLRRCHGMPPALKVGRMLGRAG